MHFIHSVEFYVILAVIAALIVAFAARPAQKGAVIERLLAGDLTFTGEPAEPAVRISCADDGTVCITRRGVQICPDGAVSLAVEIFTADIRIKERITHGTEGAPQYVEARFTLKSLRPGKYHVKYTSDQTSTFAAFPFLATPGYADTHPLHL